jgi:hypothetical protein
MTFFHMARFLYEVVRSMRTGTRQMNLCLPLALAALLVFLPAAGYAAHEEGSGGDQGAEGRSAGQAEEDAPRRGRLRFRDGPVCMCALGLSEEDIQRAQEDRAREGQRRRWWRN